MTAQLLLTFLVTAIAVGYWAWVLVYSGVFVWGRKWLDEVEEDALNAIQATAERIELGFANSRDKRLHTLYHYKHRVVKFIRDMLRCPYCTAFHLGEVTQLGFWLFEGHMLNVIPQTRHIGVLITWFALAGVGGALGYAIAYVTGKTWHNSAEEVKLKFFLQHGRAMTEDEVKTYLADES